MSKKPPIEELKFLKLSSNHQEHLIKATELGFANPDWQQYVHFICEAWFRLGEDHLGEAQKMLAAGCIRGVYSRAYYGAYNASKATRYLANGIVSLRGDDHSKASIDLPSDFPDLPDWSQKVSKLYEDRLRADYDNWTDTMTKFTQPPTDAVLNAQKFTVEAKKYLKTKFGISL